MGGFNWRRWSARAGVRALKTFAETGGALLVGAGAGETLGVMEADWLGVASVSAMAAVLSLLVSLRGLPELEQEEAPTSPRPTPRPSAVAPMRGRSQPAAPTRRSSP